MVPTKLRPTLLRALLAVALGVGLCGLGLLLFPDSNLGGGFCVVGTPLAVVGILTLFITAIAWGVGKLTRT